MGIAICESGIRTCPVNFETVNFVDSGSAALANAIVLIKWKCRMHRRWNPDEEEKNVLALRPSDREIAQGAW